MNYYELFRIIILCWDYGYKSSFENTDPTFDDFWIRYIHNLSDLIMCYKFCWTIFTANFQYLQLQTMTVCNLQ